MAQLRPGAAINKQTNNEYQKEKAFSLESQDVTLGNKVYAEVISQDKFIWGLEWCPGPDCPYKRGGDTQRRGQVRTQAEIRESTQNRKGLGLLDAPEGKAGRTLAWSLRGSVPCHLGFRLPACRLGRK